MTTTTTTTLDELIAEAQAEADATHPSSGIGNYWRIRLKALTEARETIS